MAATIVGAIGFGVSLLIGGVPSGSFLVLFVLFSIIPICIGLAPFWLLVLIVADRLALRSLPAYIAFGVVTGIVAGPTLLAFLPQMMWDLGPSLNYGGRWLNDFQINGVRFAGIGAVAAATYWLVAVPTAERRRPDRGNMQA